MIIPHIELVLAVFVLWFLSSVLIVLLSGEQKFIYKICLEWGSSGKE